MLFLLWDLFNSLINILIYFQYYLGTFLIALFTYSCFHNGGPKWAKVPANNGLFYLIKLYYAKKAVQAFQKTHRFNTQGLGENVEKIMDTSSDKEHLKQCIYGVDEKGNSIYIKFILHHENVAEVFLSLKLGWGKQYVFPDANKIEFTSIPQKQWKTKSLNIQILEPFKRLRITFNGLLRNIDSEEIEFVKFNFIWNAAGGPKHFPEDVNTFQVAKLIANTVWNDKEVLPNIQGFYQFGAVQGVIKLEKISRDIVLNLPSGRSNYRGTSEIYMCERDLTIFMVAEDGTSINLWVKYLKNNLKRICYGNVILNNGDIVNINDLHVDMDNNIFIATIKVFGHEFRCVLDINCKGMFRSINNDTNGSLSYHVTREAKINSQKANGLIEYWYSHKGEGLPPLQKILNDKKVSLLPNLLVTNLKNEESTILSLTGGKGNSLALMSTLNCKNFIIPGGFIITINAFQEQLKTGKLTKSVRLLNDVACGKAVGTLEEACSETVDLFKTESMAYSVENAIINEVNKIKNLNEDDGIKEFRWAVRSSAIGEDSEDMSAAGQNETFLGCVSNKDILKAVKNCWASLYTYQSVQYRRQNGMPVLSDMAVVVQKMVPAESAGVLFTCHPSTCDPSKIVITANNGLGESVVGAKSDPDTFILSRSFTNNLSVIEENIGSKGTMIVMNENGVKEIDNIDANKSCLSREQILELGRVGIHLEIMFGGARDIEWAFYKNNLYLLQSRPITTLNSWTDFELLHEFDTPILTKQDVFTMANVGEVCPGALTVLSQSTSQVILDQTLQLTTRKNYDKRFLKCLPLIQHHAMINVVNSIHKNVKPKIQMSSKILDLAVFGHPVINDYINDISLRRFGVFSGLAQLKETLRVYGFARKNRELLKEMKEKTKNFEINIHKNDSLIEMYDKIDRSIGVIGDISQNHCKTSAASVFYQIIAMSILMERKEELTVDHYTDFALILSSCEDVVSAEVPETLEKISKIVRAEGCKEEFVKIKPEVGVEWLKIKCPSAHSELQEFLRRHGHRLLREFEMMKDSWAMNPKAVIEMIQANCKSEKSLSKRNETVEDVISKLVSTKNNITKSLLKLIISKMRQAVGIREQTKSEFVLNINKLRIAYRQLARKMASEGLLPTRELIFFLSHYEIKQVISGTNPILIAKAMRRKRLYTKWDNFRFPELMFGVPEPEDEEKLVYGKSDVKCTGTPVCSGEIKARACVINTLEKINDLKSGDILITYSTDIGWSPYFPMLSGVVTELGGLVSHGAVVAREYGLPCIVGVANVTKLFKTGDIVQISGKTGILELVSR